MEATAQKEQEDLGIRYAYGGKSNANGGIDDFLRVLNINTGIFEDVYLEDKSREALKVEVAAVETRLVAKN